VCRLYVPFQDATRRPVSLSAGESRHGDIALPRVDALAARDKSGRTWLAVTNLDPTRAVDVLVDSPGAKLRRAQGETLTAPKVDSVNTFDAPRTVMPKPFSARDASGKLSLRLAPASVTVVAVE
jgi:alpha-N-arabinofuranosidase